MAQIDSDSEMKMDMNMDLDMEMKMDMNMDLDMEMKIAIDNRSNTDRLTL